MISKRLEMVASFVPPQGAVLSGRRGGDHALSTH